MQQGQKLFLLNLQTGKNNWSFLWIRFPHLVTRIKTYFPCNLAQCRLSSSLRSDSTLLWTDTISSENIKLSFLSFALIYNFFLFFGPMQYSNLASVSFQIALSIISYRIHRQEEILEWIQPALWWTHASPMVAAAALLAKRFCTVRSVRWISRAQSTAANKNNTQLWNNYMNCNVAT